MARLTKSDIENMISIIGSDEELKKRLQEIVGQGAGPVRDKGRLRR